MISHRSIAKVSVALILVIIGIATTSQAADESAAAATRLTKSYFSKFFLRFSPDGSHVAYSTHYANRRAREPDSRRAAADESRRFGRQTRSHQIRQPGADTRAPMLVTPTGSISSFPVAGTTRGTRRKTFSSPMLMKRSASATCETRPGRRGKTRRRTELFAGRKTHSCLDTIQTTCRFRRRRKEPVQAGAGRWAVLSPARLVARRCVDSLRLGPRRQHRNLQNSLGRHRVD